MKVVTSEQMRNIDRRASSEFGIPSIVLMENAALAVADVIHERYAEAERVAVLCGTGQNGGDGFAIARHLFNRGYSPLVVLVGDEAKVTGDSATNLGICRRMQLTVRTVGDAREIDEAMVHVLDADLVVDALFGTGLTRPLDGMYAETAEMLRNLHVPVVAVDIPSGLQASSNRVEGPVIHADLTVTFAAPKPAHVFQPAAALCGEVIVADISIPEAAIVEEGVKLSLLTPADIAQVFTPRPPDAHKGTYGHAALICGSDGRSGAAILAARGAVHAGAGLVTVLTDRDTARLVDSVSIESMTEAFDVNTSVEQLVARLKGRDAVLIGPGLPDSEESYARVRAILPHIDRPLVIDASALNALQDGIESLASLSVPKIITPHPGELARLTGSTAAAVNDDRIGAVTDAARRSGAVAVLKGHQTLIATPAGEVFINPTGNPGMASGGMGDVLAGIIVALLARGLDPLDAACAGVYIHGVAGDLLMEQQGDTGMAAMDVAPLIPRAIGRVREGR